MSASEVEVTTPEAAANALAAPPAADEAATAVHEAATAVHQAATAVNEAATAVNETPTAAHDIPAGEHEAPAVPRLAAGVELIGEFEGSGFKQPPYIARRADGQIVQMPQMLFALAEQIDGEHSLDSIAERYSHAIRRDVRPADVALLIRKQLIPLGVVATGADEESVELNKVDPLLALKFRAAVVPARAVSALTSLFTPLFLGPMMAAGVVAFVGLDGWLFFVHGVSQGLRHVLYQPALMLMLIGGVVLATAFHEIGHATACRYGGAKPGVMGVGLYLVWPAFYTDITDAYRLGRWGRLRTDLGGMYFNALFSLLVGGLYLLTSFEPLLLLILLQTFAIIQQALPLLRLDGYYILSDLTGVPDIYLRIRAVLASLIPGRKPDPRVTELRNWVRAVVTLYVLAMVVFLGVMTVALIINLPRVVATGYDSSALHFRAVGPDFRAGRPAKGVLDVVETLFLILPAIGLAFTGLRVLRRAGAGTLAWSSGHPARRTVMACAVAGLVVLASVSWWPSRGEYRAIQPGERGTLQGLIGQIRRLPSGHPAQPVALRRPPAGNVGPARRAPVTSHRATPGPVRPRRSRGSALAPPGQRPASEPPVTTQSTGGQTTAGTSTTASATTSTTTGSASSTSSSDSASSSATTTDTTAASSSSTAPTTTTTAS